jgi:hypothetical protein
MTRTPTRTTIARLLGATVLGAGLLASIGCAPFGVAASCTLADAAVRLNGAARSYTLQLDCVSTGVDGRITVNAGYDPVSKQTKEQISHPMGKVTATWRCPEDPWQVAAVRCERLQVQMNTTDGRYGNGLTQAIDNMPQDRPYSAQKLSEADRDILEARLFDALQPKPAPTPAPTPKPTPTPTPKPTKPDLAVTRLTGPTEVFDGVTAVYEVALWNDGLPANGTAQLTIGFLGGLDPMAMETTPAGFTCEPTTDAFSCTGSLGGIDDAVQTRGAVFAVRGHAVAKGEAAVSASANHDRSLDEVTVDNNLKVLEVTVK